jgi:hypothetical protein
VFTWAVTRTRFFVNSNIPRTQLALLFVVKVAVGIIYGKIAMTQMPDTWNYYFNSLKQTHLLFQHPKLYLTDIFQGINTNDVASFFSSSHSYWNNLKLNAIVKIFSIFNCFSFGNYYINVIFYSYITFFGVVAIYRVMQQHLQLNRRILIIACFLIPSFIFWCSGLHKDGFTFLATAIIIYVFYFYILKKTVRFHHIVLLLLSFFILFIFRNHILIALLPALLAWALAHRQPKKTLLIFAMIYMSGMICFFGLKYIHPNLNFPEFVAEKQNAFNHLTRGNTSISVKNLEPNATGFIKNLPQAISLSFFRPYLSDIHKPIILPAYIENILIMLLIMLTFLIPKKNLRFSAFGLFIAFFVISVYLSIGYTVNNFGAVARYRSFLLPLYLPFILNAVNWMKLKSIFFVEKSMT